MPETRSRRWSEFTAFHGEMCGTPQLDMYTSIAVAASRSMYAFLSAIT